MPRLTDDEAAAAIRAHRVELRDGLRERVLALRSAIQAGMAHGVAEQAVLDYLQRAERIRTASSPSARR